MNEGVPVPVLCKVPSDGQVKAAGEAVEILSGFEIMGEPPLLAEGGQGGQCGVPHQLVLLHLAHWLDLVVRVLLIGKLVFL